ncbi:MAG: fasciclin domain-containing protein [Pseudomonadota bacterium]
MSNTIGDIVLANSGGNGLQAFDILLAALQTADPDSTGLVNAAFDPTQNLTVFAPTDEAFIGLARVFDPSVNTEAEATSALVAASAALSPADDPAAFLRGVLEFHISVGQKSVSEIQALDSVQTLAGTDLVPDGNTLGDQEPGLADPAYVPGLTDLPADNGTVQVIDGVLSPVDFTFADGGFVWTGRGSDAVIGSDAREKIFLGSGDDFAFAGGGNDKVFGGRGEDLINGGDGRDWLSGGRDNDYVNGGDDRDYVFGGRGDDTVLGGDGNDYVSGGRGEDIVIGGSGNDYLKGGRDADMFVFNPFNPDEGHDVVKDFSLKQGDKLVLDLRGGDPDVLADIQALNDPGKVEVKDLVDAGVVTLGETRFHSLEIEHPGGTIELRGVSADIDVATLETAVEFWLA